jgi:uncharacterized damage-inducible protein DinB
MLAKSILISLLNYNYEANEQVLRQVEALTGDALNADANISYGSVFELVRHMADTEWSWRRIARGEPAQQLLWEVEDLSDVPALRRFLAEEQTRAVAYVEGLSEDELDRSVSLGSNQDDEPSAARVWQILVHLLNHSTHHRAELSRQLAEVGHPVGENDIDYLGYAVRSY